MEPIDPQLWTRDSAQQHCTACRLPFSLCRRRHHCRWCGLLFCSTCTPHSIHSLRACWQCHQRHLDKDTLTVCPCCSQTLHVSSSGVIEKHVAECTAVNDGGKRVVGSAFAVSRIKGDGAVPGECDICLEPYMMGQQLAVLNCLCKFHADCIGEWFSRGHCCPFHPSL